MSKEQIDLDQMPGIVEDFLNEADELADALESNFLKLETAPDNSDLLNEIFRAAHAIKGTSSFLGLDQITSVSHMMEELLNKLRKQQITPGPATLDVLLESVDLLRLLLDAVRRGNLEKVDIAPVVSRLADPDVDGDLQSECPRAGLTRSNGSEVRDTTAEGEDQSVDEPGDRIFVAGSAALTIRVQVERLDSILESLNRVSEVRSEIARKLQSCLCELQDAKRIRSAIDACMELETVVERMQKALVDLRMVPVGSILNRYRRLVRDLAREADKRISLQINGGEIRIDRAVIEELADPLVHLIRNACDHGIETPTERAECSKSETGVIRLSAEQSGTNVIFEVLDDGRGFNRDAFRATAVDRGYIAAGDIDSLGDAELFQLALEPGFTTVKKVTDVSGRGVGMDIVRTKVKKLGGEIELFSSPGLGTRIRIAVPVTLTVLEGLPVEIDSEIYVIPAGCVLNTDTTEFELVKEPDMSFIRYRTGERIPIFELALSENAKDKPNSAADARLPIIIEVDGVQRCILVDRIFPLQEILTRTASNALVGSAGRYPVTLLKDGRRATIVTTAFLMDKVRTESASEKSLPR